MTRNEEKHDFNEYRRLILEKLEKLDKNVETLDSKLDQQIIEFTTLKTQFNSSAAIVGFVAGLIPTLISMAWTYFFGNNLPPNHH